jgi:photosystem I P700 chlorophyll a apoprotein A2
LDLLYDFETMTDDRRKSLQRFLRHTGQLAIIFLWTSGNLFHVAWQGNFEQWVIDPVHVRQLLSRYLGPHFGQPAVEAFTRGGASGPVNISTRCLRMVVHYRYAYKPRFIHRFCFLSFSFSSFLICRLASFTTNFQPSLSWFKDAESRLNHHLSGLFWC